MIAANSIALAKPVTGRPPFDEWHINCAIYLLRIVIPIKLFRDIILWFWPCHIISNIEYPRKE
jgi:hypothetical protein